MYVASNYMGDTPARSYQDERMICINQDVFFQYPNEIRKFILLHEKGHIKKDTDSEIEADDYAFKHMTGRFKGANRWSVYAISQVLPFTSKEQYLRLLNMYKNALNQENRGWIRKPYEEAGGPEYEMNSVLDMEREARDTPEEFFSGQSSRNAVPIGPYVDIAHEAWVKQALGMPLSGYDIGILDKYPMPDDFMAAQIQDPENLAGPLDKDPGNYTDKVGEFESWIMAASKKPHFWLWVAVGVVAILLLSKRNKS